MPNWKQGRAIGKLLTMLIRFRQDDWRDILLVIDRELGARTGRQHGAREAQEYLRGWVQGHFLNIDYSSQAQMPVRRKSSKQARRAKQNGAYGVTNSEDGRWRISNRGVVGQIPKLKRTIFAIWKRTQACFPTP